MNNTSQNPYSRLLHLFDANYFYGRTDEIMVILQIISAPHPTSQAIYGSRTIGKTTLLNYLKDPDGALVTYHDFLHSAYQVGGGRYLHFVYINLNLFTQDDELFFLLLVSLENSLDEESCPISDFNFPRYDDHHTKQALHHILRDSLKKLDELGVRVVFLLDDFDNVVMIFTSEDDHLLRTLADVAPFIIATENPIPELRPEIVETSPLLGILRPSALGLLPEESAKLLIKEPAHGAGMIISDNEVAFLVGIGGKHPFLLLSVCEFYFNMRRDYPDLPKLIAQHDNRNVKNQFLSRLLNLTHVKTILQRTWSGLSLDEQRVLLRIADENDNPKSQEAILIAGRLVNKALAELDFQHGIYRISGGLLHEYLSRYASPAPVPPKTSSQTMLATKQLIQTLSPIDRNVFNYLVKNPNRVCTFDELLDAVWTDTDKSKRALEAAIHRLRRHLTDGAEIQNIRGRGYKYVTQSVGQPALVD
ncbi:MAG: winged helix-turn-helix domain-containing protein [Phototrophicales bacterium]|nr:winged helix-turn-helix domain-containing protein [Phototrophicales bacterium]